MRVERRDPALVADPRGANSTTFSTSAVARIPDQDFALVAVPTVYPAEPRTIFSTTCRGHSQAEAGTWQVVGDPRLARAKAVAGSSVPVPVISRGEELAPGKGVAASNSVRAITRVRLAPGKAVVENSGDRGIDPVAVVIAPGDRVLAQAKAVVENSGDRGIVRADRVLGPAVIGGRRTISPITDPTGTTGTIGGTITGTIGTAIGTTVGTTTGTIATTGITATGGTTAQAGTGTMAITLTGGLGPRGRR